MKKILTVFLALVSISLAGQNNDVSSKNMETMDDSLSYFLGLTLGYDLKSLPFDADADLLLEGINEALLDRSDYDQEKARAIFQELQGKFQGIEEAKAGEKAQENLVKGEAFLLENGSREGVVSTESGLQYEVIELGDGANPEETSEVEVHYEGTLIDGTVFDSSYERGESISFPLNGVIPGWTEGVQLMPVGSTYKFYIPANLAYGARDQGPIPGNSVLIFKIELLGIK